MPHCEHAYLNRQVVRSDEASISSFDVGLLRGYAVFALLQTIGGTQFMFAEDLQRFRESAGLLGLEVPVDDIEIAAIVAELLDRNSREEATVRFVLTAG